MTNMTHSMRAPKTKSIQANIQASIAVRPSALGDMGKVKRNFNTIFCWCIFQEDAHLGCVGGDGVEDVDEDEEEGDEESHPARNHVHRNEEGNPGHDNKQT